MTNQDFGFDFDSYRRAHELMDAGIQNFEDVVAIYKATPSALTRIFIFEYCQAKNGEWLLRFHKVAGKRTVADISSQEYQDYCKHKEKNPEFVLDTRLLVWSRFRPVVLHNQELENRIKEIKAGGEYRLTLRSLEDTEKPDVTRWFVAKAIANMSVMNDGKFIITEPNGEEITLKWFDSQTAVTYIFFGQIDGDDGIDLEQMRIVNIVNKTHQGGNSDWQR